MPILKKPLSLHKIFSIVIAAALTLLLFGCAAIKKEAPITRERALRRISFFSHPSYFDDMAYDGLAHSIFQSISYLKTVSPSKKFRFGKDGFSADHMIQSLEYFQNFIDEKPSSKDLKKFIKKNYWVYQSIGSSQSKQVLFTGYYEPIILGSLTESDEYRFPVYARPDDLLTIDLSLFSPRFKGRKIIGRYTGRKIVPYYNRKEIEQEGHIKDRARPLAWVKNQVDLFFLQIQGSGKIYLENGQTLNVHYHTSNGRPYKSIGKLLIKKGKIERAEMSMQKIRSYLQEHPDETEEILNYNPSYVFFKIEADGPLGYLEVKLTPARSLAVDRRIFPLPALTFVETLQPLISADGRIHQWIDFNRFAISQDTGGAIRGPGRADFFWGNGPYAEIAAGHMQHRGKLYFLILKPDKR